MVLCLYQCLFLSCFLLQVFAKRLTTKQTLFITSFFNIICVVLFSFTYSINIPFIIIVTSLYGFSMGLSMPTHTTLLTEEFVQERATAIGMYNFIRYLGMGTGPLIGGFLLFNQNYFWIFFLGAIIFLLVILYAMKMLRFPATQKQNRDLQMVSILNSLIRNNMNINMFRLSHNFIYNRTFSNFFPPSSR